MTTVRLALFALSLLFAGCAIEPNPSPTTGDRAGTTVMSEGAYSGADDDMTTAMDGFETTGGADGVDVSDGFDGGDGIDGGSPTDSAGSTDTSDAADAADGADGADSDVDAGDGGTTTDSPLPECSPLSGVSHIVDLHFIDSPDKYTCDANNDGKINADDGSLNDFLLTGLVGGLFDVNAQLADGVMEGKLLFLLDLEEGATAGTVQTNLYQAQGLDSQPDPLCGVGENLTEMCEWQVSASSFDDDGKPKVSLEGTLSAAGDLAAGPGDIVLPFDLQDVPLSLNMSHSRITGNATGCIDLKGASICGTVTKADIVAAIQKACSGDTPPDFCGILEPFLSSLDTMIECDPCTLNFGLEGVPGIIVE